MKITFTGIRLAAMHFGSLLDPRDYNTSVYRRNFRSLFGCNQSHVMQLWNTIDQEIVDLRFDHVGWMLAALYFLRCYPTIDEIAIKLGKNQVTVRKHIWQFVDHIATLDVVRDHRRYPWLTWTDPANIVQLAIRQRIKNLRRISGLIERHNNELESAQPPRPDPVADPIAKTVETPLDVVPVDNNEGEVGE